MHWRERFDADPEVYMAFVRLFAEYVRWLRSVRG
jgi:hypothetical protein